MPPNLSIKVVEFQQIGALVWALGSVSIAMIVGLVVGIVFVAKSFKKIKVEVIRENKVEFVVSQAVW